MLSSSSDGTKGSIFIRNSVQGKTCARVTLLRFVHVARLSCTLILFIGALCMMKSDHTDNLCPNKRSHCIKVFLLYLHLVMLPLVAHIISNWSKGGSIVHQGHVHKQGRIKLMMLLLSRPWWHGSGVLVTHTRTYSWQLTPY